MTPPRLRTRFPAKQRLLRLGGVVAYGRSGERSALAIGATLRIGKRSYRLKPATRPAGARKLVRMKATLTRRARRALRKALRHDRHPVVRVGLRARDAAGNRSKLVRRPVAVRR